MARKQSKYHKEFSRLLKEEMKKVQKKDVCTQKRDVKEVRKAFKTAATKAKLLAKSSDYKINKIKNRKLRKKI